MAQPIGTDTPFSAAPTRVDAVAIDTDVGTGQGSAYVLTTAAVSRRLEVTFGGRLDRFAFIDATTLGPRLALVAHVRPAVDVTASFGRYSQMPALAFLNADPVNRSLAPMRAEHRVVGLEWRPAVSLRLTVEGYEKRYRDYPVSVEYPTLSLASTGDFYGIGGLLMPLRSVGRGRARGIELFMQQKLTQATYGQVSYSFSRTEHAAADGVLRRGGFDAPHVLALVGGRKFGDRFELSTKLTIASGRPITPFLLEESQAQNREILDVARLNAEGVPPTLAGTCEWTAERVSAGRRW